MKKFPKAILVLLLLITAFHLSGVESAFCNDANPLKSETHGCQICQASHHSAVTLDRSAVAPVVAPVSFSVFEQVSFIPQDPAFSFFRPPITR